MDGKLLLGRLDEMPITDGGVNNWIVQRPFVHSSDQEGYVDIGKSFDENPAKFLRRTMCF